MVERTLPPITLTQELPPTPRSPPPHTHDGPHHFREHIHSPPKGVKQPRRPLGGQGARLTFPLSYEGVPVMTKESLKDRVEPKRLRAGAMPRGDRRVIRASNCSVSGFFLNPKITPWVKQAQQHGCEQTMN